MWCSRLGELLSLWELWQHSLNSMFLVHIIALLIHFLTKHCGIFESNDTINVFPLKNVIGIFSCFLPLVWSRMRPNPHGQSHHFLSKSHGNSMTWTCPKSMSWPSMENKYSVDKWHGIVMEFGVDLDQTYSVDLWRCEMTRNFHENPRLWDFCFHTWLIFHLKNWIVFPDAWSKIKIKLEKFANFNDKF